MCVTCEHLSLLIITSLVLSEWKANTWSTRYKLFSAIDVFRAYINHECSYISPHRSVNLGVKVVLHKYQVIFIPIQQRAGYIDGPVYVGRYTPGGAYLSES